MLWATFVFIYFWSVAEDRAGSSKMSFVLINSSFIAEVFLNKSLPMLLFPETSARCFALLKVLVKCSWRLLCMCSCFTTWYSFEMLHWRPRSKHLPGGALGHPSCCIAVNKKKCAVLVRLCVQIMRIHHIPLVVNVIPSLRCPTPTFPSQEFGGIIFFTPELSVLFLIFLLRFFMSVVVALHLKNKKTAGCWKMDVRRDNVKTAFCISECYKERS